MDSSWPFSPNNSIFGSPPFHVEPNPEMRPNAVYRQADPFDMNNVSAGIFDADDVLNYINDAANECRNIVALDNSIHKGQCNIDEPHAPAEKGEKTPTAPQSIISDGKSIRSERTCSYILSDVQNSMGYATPMTINSLDEEHVMPELQNVVTTVELGCKLDLKKISLRARNSEYNPRRFAGLIMRIRVPRSTALIFTNGKIVCTGTKSVDDSRLAARKFARIIQKMGYAVKFFNFKVHNMVGSCDLQFRLNLEGLSHAHSTFCTYEPEIFPGLVYRMVRPRIVLLIFLSGKIVLTGTKIRQEIDDAFKQIFPILKKFKRNGPATVGLRKPRFRNKKHR